MSMSPSLKLARVVFGTSLNACWAVFIVESAHVQAQVDLLLAARPR